MPFKANYYTNEPYPGILGNLSTPDKVWKTVNRIPVSRADKKLLFRINTA